MLVSDSMSLIAPVSMVSSAPSEKVNGINKGKMFISGMRGVIHLQRAIVMPLKDAHLIRLF